MGTKLRRKKFTRKEKIELSKGITPKRLRDELNRQKECDELLQKDKR